MFLGRGEWSKKIKGKNRGRKYLSWFNLGRGSNRTVLLVFKEISVVGKPWMSALAVRKDTEKTESYPFWVSLRKQACSSVEVCRQLQSRRGGGFWEMVRKPRVRTDRQRVLLILNFLNMDRPLHLPSPFSETRSTPHLVSLLFFLQPNPGSANQWKQ